MRPELVVALDCPSLGEATALATSVRESADMFKVGLELYVAEGPLAVRSIAGAGRPIFLDLKLHDIPETVERAVARASDLGVALLTVHASGGPTMLERAVRVAERGKTRIVAVTVLTSLDEADLHALGLAETPPDHVLRLARLAASAGVSAFVCSPREVGLLRRELGKDAMLVTPGVRVSEGAPGDQKRTDTPEGAIASGASAIVVGRPIRDAASPAEVARRIAAAIHA